MEGLLDEAHRFGVKIEKWAKNKIKKQVWRNLKGFKKDPLFYLGTIAVILFLVVSFIPLSNRHNGEINSLIFSENPQNSEKSFLIPEVKVKESPDLSLVQGNSLTAISPPIVVTPKVLGALIEGSELEEVRREIIRYIVQEGDSLWSIAVKYDIDIDTIVWTNDIKSALIQPGQDLFILPVSGVMHLVEGGDTVDKLAEKYKTTAEKIVAFNDLGGESIFEGEILIIPDGQMPFYSEVQPVYSSGLVGLSTNNFYGQSHDFPDGQCTWWVAQKRAIPSWGNAKDWMANAMASGYSVCQGRYCSPQFGAVISLQGSRVYGHVGYVERVRGDKVIFSEMNYIGWGRMNYRTLRVGDPIIKGYIY